MSLSAFRSALRPRRGLWRNLLVTLAAVAALLVGLLAMHSLNLEHGMSTSMASTVAPTGHHNAAMVTGNAPVNVANDSGKGPWSPEHSMTTMTCILALLVSALPIGIIRLVTAWRPVLRRVTGVLKRWAALPSPQPPSLHALCISRT
jgi:hypothetical protein